VLPIRKFLQIRGCERDGDPRSHPKSSGLLCRGKGCVLEGDVLWRNATASVLSIQHDATGQRRLDKSDEGASYLMFTTFKSKYSVLPARGWLKFKRTVSSLMADTIGLISRPLASFPWS